MTPSGRLRELDALRGVAAVSVMAYHYTTYYSTHIDPGSRPPFDVAWGRYGVNLFFVISGYVITASARTSTPPLTFALHRAIRLYPTYVAAVVVAASFAHWGPLPGWDLGLVEVMANLTMLQRHFGIPSVDGVYWTLAVECLFYAGVAALLASRSWARPRRDAAMVAWTVASLAWAVGPLADDQAWVDRPVALLLRYGPLFVAGMLLKDGPGPTASTRVASILAGTIGLAALGASTPATEIGFDLGAIALVAVAARGGPRALRWRPAVAVGEASYVLYLFHSVPGLVVLYRLRQRMPSGLAIATVSAAVLAFSLVAHRRVEAPVQRWCRTALGRVTARPSVPAET